MKEAESGHVKLLEETRGDKTAISRALAQNKQLKQQLEEIQEGFVKLVRKFSLIDFCSFWQIFYVWDYCNKIAKICCTQLAKKPTLKHA